MATTKQFFSYILKHGVSKPNRFQVIIPIPAGLQRAADSNNDSLLSQFLNSDVVKLIRDIVSGGNSVSRGLDIMIDETALPGKNLVSSEVKYNGDMYALPYGATYNDITFSFKTSSDLYEKNIIDKWMAYIYDPTLHEIAYMDDYVVDITINQLDENDNIVHSVILKDAFPMSADDMNLSNEERDSTHKVNTVFAYRRWLSDTLTATSTSNVGSLSQTPLGPYINPILSNPAVQKGLEIFERETGIDLEGEAVNVYNQLNDIVKNTTGSSINQAVGLIESIKAETEINDDISDDQKAKIIGIIDDTLSALK